ncbi:MAG TPA: pyruvate dehydrogenase (acetyl-transferring) E1 component subunit alpha [Clostridiaceae bacterium]|nr:pyruvate dehydrogenase (acetyl-transferring) E1 component subunit alpha [Clostridiaceae bacterium]
MFIDKFNPLEDDMIQVMDENGNIVNPDFCPDVSDEDILTLYKTMRKARAIDSIALSLQRQGRLLTYASNLGQEAAQVGSGYALKKSDWAVPAFRELGMWLIKGWPVEKIFQYWYGNEWGSHFGEEIRLLPIAVPIASQLQHAVGIGMAARFRGDDDVVMAYSGEGGTSQGDFHEALNFAAVFNTPNVFFIQNNHYAISVPLSRQTASRNIATKALGYGMPGVLVDGNDVFAVLAASREAVQYARESGPVLIEAFTFRMGPHTTSDDPTKYRSDEEVRLWQRKDPIMRLEKYLMKENLMTEDAMKSMTESLEQDVMDAYKSIEHTSDTGIEEIFSYHFENLTPQLKEQLEDYQAFLKGASHAE